MANGCSSLYTEGRVRLQSRLRLLTRRRSAAGHRQIGRGSQARGSFPDAPRHHRIRQERDDRVDDSRGAATDPDPGSQQVARRAVDTRDARVLPRESRRVLRQLLRLLPTRGIHRVQRYVHREGLVDQRRDRPVAALGHGRPADPPRHHRRRDRSAASTAWATPRSTGGNCSTSVSASTTTCAASCVGWSTCSSTATT